MSILSHITDNTYYSKFSVFFNRKRKFQLYVNSRRKNTIYERKLNVLDYLNAFWVGGLICLAAQLLIDFTKLTPARILTGCVVLGVVLSAIGLYEPLANYAGAGATVPLSGFGHLMAQGVKTEIESKGAIGILTGGLSSAAAGITAAIVLGVIASLIGKSRLK